MKRRTVIRALSMGLFGATSGCTSVFDADAVSLGRIDLLNSTPTSQTGHVDVRQNGNSVFSTTETVAAYEDDDEYIPWTTIECGWPSEPGQYTVHATFDGHDDSVTEQVGSDEATRSSDLEREAQYDTDCYAAFVDLFSSNSVRLWFVSCRELEDNDRDLCSFDGDS